MASGIPNPKMLFREGTDSVVLRLPGDGTKALFTFLVARAVLRSNSVYEIKVFIFCLIVIIRRDKCLSGY